MTVSPLARAKNTVTQGAQKGKYSKVGPFFPKIYLNNYSFQSAMDPTMLRN